jgi:propanol-preferring alcohol dehydrogenase
MSSTNIPTKALGAFFEKQGGPVTIREYDVKQPDQLQVGEALVKVEYSGVCHTDLHAMLGDWPLDVKLPLCGGHEGAGTIVAIGKHTTTQLKVGDKVGIKWIADACLECSYCRQGYEPLCPHVKLSGYTVDGSFQQYAVSYTRMLTKIPDGLPLEDCASFLCAGLTVYKAIKQSGARPGQWAVIPGSGGGLGHLAVQYAAKIFSLRVIGIDTGSEKEKLSKDLGAEVFIDFKQEKDIVSAIKKVTPDRMGVHAAIVTAASAASYEQALDYVRPGGTVVAVGLPANTSVSANVFWHVVQEKRLVGSYVGNRQDAIEALEFAATGQVICHQAVLELKDLPDIYEQMQAGKLTGRTVMKLF